MVYKIYYTERKNMKPLFDRIVEKLDESSTPEQFLKGYMKMSTTINEDFHCMELFLNESINTLNEADKLTNEVEKRLTDNAKGITKGLVSNESEIKKKSRAIVKLLQTAISLKSDSVANSSFKHKALRMAISAFLILGSAFIPGSLIVKLASILVAGIGTSAYTVARAKKEVDVLDSQINYIGEKIDSIDDSKKRYELNKLLKDLEAQQRSGEKKLATISSIKDSAGSAKSATGSAIRNGASNIADKNRQRSASKAELRQTKREHRLEDSRENKAYRKQRRRENSEYKQAARRERNTLGSHGTNF